MPDIFIAGKDNSKKHTKKESSDKKTVKQFEEVIKAEEKKYPELQKAEKKMGWLSAFSIEPSEVTFEDQQENEKVLLFLRRHLITNLDWALIALILALIPPLISLIPLFSDIDLFGILRLPSRFSIFFLIFYYSSIFSFMLVNLMSWFYNSGIVTTRRIMDIDLHDLVYKDVATTRLSSVQDVTYVQTGFVRSLFHFGNVQIQTAAERGHFEIEAVPHPDKVSHLIEDFMGEVE